MTSTISIRADLAKLYHDVYTPETLEALDFLQSFNGEIKKVMEARLKRRAQRQLNNERINFLDAQSIIPRTSITIKDARDGNFEGSIIPSDLQQQWIQGTGPAAKPNSPLKTSIRNVAYALLSGADGWMFDGEDALGQINTMSLDNQRNLKLAIRKGPVFLDVAQQVAAEMNRWSNGFLGTPIVTDWEQQLNFTTIIFRARGLHLDDRHVRGDNGVAMAASIVDLTLYVVNNHQALLYKG